MADIPSAYSLWVRAGGGTPTYSREDYIALCRQYGLIVRREAQAEPDVELRTADAGDGDAHP